MKLNWVAKVSSLRKTVGSTHSQITKIPACHHIEAFGKDGSFHSQCAGRREVVENAKKTDTTTFKVSVAMTNAEVVKAGLPKWEMEEVT